MTRSSLLDGDDPDNIIRDVAAVAEARIRPRRPLHPDMAPAPCWRASAPGGRALERERARACGTRPEQGSKWLLAHPAQQSMRLAQRQNPIQSAEAEQHLVLHLMQAVAVAV
mmetsp:Transcript_44457/g.102752  ORF Transcript_44457/g.102752 Transcript_44457/m.102752 type:complete len:112 (-) Transcript_44457:437-772(-)